MWSEMGNLHTKVKRSIVFYSLTICRPVEYCQFCKFSVLLINSVNSVN